MSHAPLTSTLAGMLKSSNPGRPPRLDWLSISKLVVNTTYQRPITKSGENTIKRIMEQFHWSRFSPVIVREVPGKGIFEIIDGQHRSTAALCCGYDRVPAMIVQATDDEAARIFAAVNGNVTPMQPLAVYKAALAGGEQWALESRDAARAGGCEILTYPVPKLKQKPLQTMAVQAVRNAWRQHGPQTLAATFQLLAASREADKPGYLTSALIQGWNRILASRPGWVRNIDGVAHAVRTLSINLAFEEPGHAEKKIEARVGDGRRGADADDVKSKVADALDRKLSPQMIAATLRLPYAEVDRLVSEVRQERLTGGGASG
jgi:hypothetical protein